MSSGEPHDSGGDETTVLEKFRDGVVAQLGTSFGQLIALATAGGISGVIVWAEHENGGVLFLIALAVLVVSVVVVVAFGTRTRLRRAVREQAAKRERVERQLKTVSERLRAERDDATQRVRESLSRVQELEGAIESGTSELTCWLEYTATFEDILSGNIEICQQGPLSKTERDTLLERVLHVARSSLCQHRGADTKLAVLRDEREGRTIVHAAGARAGLCTTPRPLADLIAEMAESTELVSFDLSGVRHHLVVLADGSLSSIDRTFVRLVVTAYQTTTLIATLGSNVSLDDQGRYQRGVSG
jgi:hypothetical protein